MKGDQTREAIKTAARRLFAIQGIDGVSIREIALAANQKNSGSVNYYFGSKEALVSELVVDGAQAIDACRNAQLDQLLSRGQPASLKDVLMVLVQSSLLPREQFDDTYLRFIHWVQARDRTLFFNALNATWNSGYLRGLELIRGQLANLSPELVNQRLVFMGLFLTAALSSREAALDGKDGAHPFWDADHTMDNLVDSLAAMLQAKPSQ